jgi:nucleotide-binding universal stress UspA family protein
MNGILVGYDGSGHSLRALEWAAREAVVRRVPLTVLSVCQAVPDRWRQAPVDVAADQGLKEIRTLAEEAADKALAQAGGDLPRPRVAIQALRGNPAEELLRAAPGADMIVVGSRGAGGFRKLLLGSVSSHLTHHARCPVVVIPDDDI